MDMVSKTSGQSRRVARWKRKNSPSAILGRIYVDRIVEQVSKTPPILKFMTHKRWRRRLNRAGGPTGNRISISDSAREGGTQIAPDGRPRGTVADELGVVSVDSGKTATGPVQSTRL